MTQQDYNHKKPFENTTAIHAVFAIREEKGRKESFMPHWAYSVAKAYQSPLKGMNKPSK